MHNLHIIVLPAGSAGEAMQAAEAQLAGWGDENNWSSIAGATCEDGTCHPGDADSRYAGERTLDELNGLLEQTVRTAPTEGTLTLMETMATAGLSALDDIRESDRSAAYRLLIFCEHVYALDCAGLLGTEGAAKRNGPLSVFTQEYRPWEFAEFGVTHLEDSLALNEKKYAVLVDMHS